MIVLKPYCERYGRFLSLTDIRLHDCLGKRRHLLVWKTAQCLAFKLRKSEKK